MKKIIAGILFGVLAFVKADMLPAKDSPPQLRKYSEAGEKEEYIKQLIELYEKVRNHYVDTVPDERFWVGALKGAMRALDPHSDYLSPKEFESMKERTKGEFAGIGIEMTQEYGVIKVISPIDDTPAFNAGIKAGDYIVWIDGEPVMGMSIEEAAGKLRGAKGDSVVLKIAREGKDPFDVKINRDMIRIRPIKYRLEGNIGYIRVSAFNDQTASMLRAAVNDIKKKLGAKLEGVIFDLRNNPGGVFEQALECVDFFIDEGEIVSVRGRDPQKIQRFNALPGDILYGWPIVVLINAGSASCSEIFAAAMQDHRRAIIVGQRSFGKGSVQIMTPNNNKKTGSLMTVARYYPPSGYPIQGNGVTPDVIIQQAEVKLVEDNRRREENLPGALKPIEGFDHSKEPSKQLQRQDDLHKKKEANQSMSKEKMNDGKIEGASPAALPESEQDYQLARALDLLKIYALYMKIPRKATVGDHQIDAAGSTQLSILQEKAVKEEDR